MGQVFVKGFGMKTILKRKTFRSALILELKFYLSAFLEFLNKDIKKFIIFAQGRSGSSFLTDLLNSHPDIRCDGEILNVKWSGKKLFPTFYVKSVAKTSKEKVYGFHVKFYQLYDLHNRPHQNVNPKKFLINLHKSDWKIIYLKRNNVFRQTISNFVAESSGIYHLRNEDELNLPKIQIDVDRILERMAGRIKCLSYEKEILKTIPHLEIIYEIDLLKNPEKGIDKVLKYLEVRPYPVKSTLHRTSKDKLQDYIINYNEISEHISKTKYSKYLLN